MLLKSTKKIITITIHLTTPIERATGCARTCGAHPPPSCATTRFETLPAPVSRGQTERTPNMNEPPNLAVGSLVIAKRTTSVRDAPPRGTRRLARLRLPSLVDY